MFSLFHNISIIKSLFTCNLFYDVNININISTVIYLNIPTVIYFMMLI